MISWSSITKKIKEYYENISEFYNDNISSNIMYHANGIYNLFYYFKIIYNDRDWDGQYIYIILKRKLEKVLKRYETTKYYVGQESEEKRIKFCVNTLDRLMKDNYRNKMYLESIEKYGENKMKYIPDDSWPGCVEFIICHDKCTTPELESEAHKNDMKRYELARLDEDRDVKILFNLMSKYIRHWWD